MVRFTSYIGLSKKAKNYIARRMRHGTLVEILDFPNRQLKIGEHHTYFTDPFGYNYEFSLDSIENRPFVLYFRVFKDLVRNRLIYECEETSPWYSGPNVMTFLKDEFGNIIKCSSYGRFEEGEYRFYDDSGRWVSSGNKEDYEKATYMGRPRFKKTVQ